MRCGVRTGIAAALVLVASARLFAPDFEQETYAACAPVVGLEAATQSAEALPRLHSMLVSRRGEIGFERYFHGKRATQYANIKSASKSIISALTGIAIDRGLIGGLGTTVDRFFPELTTPGADPDKRKITIEDLLTMRSGLVSTSGRNYGAWVRSPNWVRFILSHPMEREPGLENDYSTGNTHLLSAILTKAAKKDTWAFAQEALGRPLGISFAQWPRDPQGVYFGGNDMLMTPRQMLRFGELYLQRGRMEGRQVVPESWVETSWVGRGRSRWSGRLYGYGWWLDEMAGAPVYFAWGFGGQYVFVVPALELVIVTTSSPNAGEDRRGHRSALWDLVEQQVVAVVANAEPDSLKMIPERPATAANLLR